MNSPNDPLWFKNAIIYQLHVKAFADSDGDGVGDFQGLIGKLDYLADLGVTALWLLPFYPSPLRDDGYDIADYTAVHPSYGTLDDFKSLLEEAHKRNLRVITELVLNHTSDQHPWFQRARRAPSGSTWRNFYVWSGNAERYRDARIIFKDFEHSNWSWDPVAGAYFWHRFYSHQPDLNFEHPEVQEAMIGALDFWLGLGVDGLRLDAVPYLFEKEGTNCENLPETHAYLRRLRAHIDAHYPNRMLLAEANQWPEDAVRYFGQGDECHMAFHFPVMPRMFMALQMEDRFPILDILDQTPAIPDNCQWAIFLRNHDELTLEMVTDEERDYMYRMYAADPQARINLGIRRRLAGLLGNNRRKIELMHMLLLSLPGTPVIYYGDEIGMGDNIYLGDRNGVRTPMQWSPDRNAGFSRANPQKLYFPVVVDPEFHYESINVETQERNLSSLLWWTRRLIEMRGRYPALGRGTIQFLPADNGKVLAFLRRDQEDTVLVLINLSRFAQPVELDLSPFAGLVPREVFSRNKYPPIRQTPYFFTLAAHDHYWLALEPAKDGHLLAEGYVLPALEVKPSWEALTNDPGKASLEQCLPSWMQTHRWFAGKAKVLQHARLRELLSVGDDVARIALVDIAYLDAAAETYLIPLQIARGDESRRLVAESPRAVIIRLHEDAVLYDATEDEAFRAALFQTMLRQERLANRDGYIVGTSANSVQARVAPTDLPLASRVFHTEQSNSSIIYDGRFFMKLYRKVECGLNPDRELTQFLSERGFPQVPAYCGSIEYRKTKSAPQIFSLLVENIPNEGDAWKYTLDSLGRYFERVLARKPEMLEASLLLEVIGGVYPERARLLGQRTAEMHLAFASERDDPAFSPEPFSSFDQRSLYQSMRATARRMTDLVRKKLPTVSDRHRLEVEDLLSMEGEILDRMELVLGQAQMTRIRIHGDFHLGQVLHTGKDFVIIDFEGEPARSLSERRMKRSALRDVAGMLRSFHYAAYASLWHRKTVRAEDQAFLEPWAEAWAQQAQQTFLDSYLASAGSAPFLPREPESFMVLLNALVLEKASYEVVYELNNRPDWVVLPARGIRTILREPSNSANKGHLASSMSA
jgi:maltose alpha-D-glucosyltransferase/alpha-amylase